MLTDTHAHLYWESYKDDLDEVLQRSLTGGVTTLINVGVDVETSKKALKMVERKLQGIAGLQAYSTIGIHPHEAVKYAMDTDVSIHEHIEDLKNIYMSNPKKVVAVGECGLDFFFENNPDHFPSNLSDENQKELQRRLLLAQKDLAKKLNLPLIIHIRDDRSKNPANSECWDEAVDLLKDHWGIFHCYSGLEQTTQRILGETRFLISFAATLTYPKNEYLRDAARIIPLGRIVLETDCPFLPPQSNRGERNEPQSVGEIAQLISELRGISFGEVAAQTTQNAKRIFKLP